MKLTDLTEGSIQAQIVVNHQGRTVGLFAFEDAWLRVWPDEDGYHLCRVQPGANVHAWLDHEYPGHEVLIDQTEEESDPFEERVREAAQQLAADGFVEIDRDASGEEVWKLTPKGRERIFGRNGH